MGPRKNNFPRLAITHSRVAWADLFVHGARWPPLLPLRSPKGGTGAGYKKPRGPEGPIQQRYVPRADAALRASERGEEPTLPAQDLSGWGAGSPLHDLFEEAAFGGGRTRGLSSDYDPAIRLFPIETLPEAETSSQ